MLRRDRRANVLTLSILALSVVGAVGQSLSIRTSVLFILQQDKGTISVSPLDAFLFQFSAR